MLELRDVVRIRPDGTAPFTEDPLPLLGESQSVKLEPGETRKIWLTFRSHSLVAGTHHATLKAGELASRESPMEIPVTLEVSPVRLPNQFTYRECELALFKLHRERCAPGGHDAGRLGSRDECLCYPVCFCSGG